MNDSYELEIYECWECGHTWILICYVSLTNEIRINWLDKVESEHRRIHEENDY